MKQQVAICFALICFAFFLVLGSGNIQPVRACYGPCITANISSTQINLYDSVTVAGQICPPAPNTTVRVAFTRPDYTYLERYVLTDSETGEFTVTETLDAAGYWNVFPIYGFICDRLYVNVTDPSPPLNPTPMPSLLTRSR